MKTKMRPRYYCDHCGKGNGSAWAMTRHEIGCTKNPQRVCGVCRVLGDVCGEPPAPPRDELLRILDAEGFPAMRDAAHDCPACILSALRVRNVEDEYGQWTVAGPDDGRNEWKYKTAKAELWGDINQYRKGAGLYG